MYPSIKLLLSLTICVGRLGFTPTPTPWTGRGGIRLRLTDGESEARLVQHLLSRWWERSEDGAHRWNSKHPRSSCCVCFILSGDLHRTRAYRRANADVLWWPVRTESIVEQIRLVTGSEIEMGKTIRIRKREEAWTGEDYRLYKWKHKTTHFKVTALNWVTLIHQRTDEFTWRPSGFLFFSTLGFISSSAQFVQRDQRPFKDFPWPGDVNLLFFFIFLLSDEKTLVVLPVCYLFSNDDFV